MPDTWAVLTVYLLKKEREEGRERKNTTTPRGMRPWDHRDGTGRHLQDWGSSSPGCFSCRTFWAFLPRWLPVAGESARFPGTVLDSGWDHEHSRSLPWGASAQRGETDWKHRGTQISQFPVQGQTMKKRKLTSVKERAWEVGATICRWSGGASLRK